MKIGLVGSDDEVAGERRSTDEHAAEHRSPVDQAHLDLLLDASQSDRGLDHVARLLDARGGSYVRHPDALGGVNPHRSRCFVAVEYDVERQQPVVEQLEILDMERTGAGAGVDLGADALDAPIWQGDPFAPADEKRIERARVIYAIS